MIWIVFEFALLCLPGNHVSDVICGVCLGAVCYIYGNGSSKAAP